MSRLSNQRRHRDSESQPQSPPSLAIAMNMLAGLNERLDHNLAHLTSLACALGGARPGTPSALSAEMPAPAGIAREFVDHLQAAHRSIDEMEQVAQRLTNAIEG